MEQQLNIAQEAAGILKRETSAWDTATAFITEKVAFNMRNLIRQCRKNYWGIFDEPIDPTNGRKKTWVPLTETMVEAAVKNIDLDTKDITFRAKKVSSIGFVPLIRAIVQNALQEARFGEALDDAERRLAIDGTQVWKTTSEKDKEGKRLRIRSVDLLNVYIDPTAPSIQEADAFIERALYTLDDFKRQAKEEKWINTENVKGTQGLPRTDGTVNMTSRATSGETPFVEVYERWGKMPKSLMTGKQEDADTLVDGHIICSRDSSEWKTHLVAEYNGEKPYEEAWYTRVPGRWYGKGIAEKLIMIQSWINTIVNIRINRAVVSQLGIFKIKRGSGITPQMISRLAANGALLVKDTSDIEQFVMQEASQSSYQDEEDAKTWAERVTSAYEAITGEALPASTTATQSALQSRSAQSQFVLIREGIGMFLERWMDCQALPIIMKNVTKGDLIRLTGDPSDLRVLDDTIVHELAARALEKSNTSLAQGDMNGAVDASAFELEIQRAREQLSRMGSDRYMALVNNLDPEDFDCKVEITNESVDKGVLVSNLMTMLQAAPEYRDAIIQQTFDTLGLAAPKPKPMMPAAGVAGPALSPGPQSGPTMMTEANTINAAA